MKRLSPLLFLSTLALAQVGLLDGPRPSTEVRGTLQGNAREGYRVVVEFLVESGANPVQGSMNQSLWWNGRLYLCVSGCDYFTLSGYAPNTPYNGAVFNLYDSGNRLRGRASVSTVYDSQNRPSYHQVQYAVWPLQGAKTWTPSPDNPVPLEAGGWLSARPPGGSARERYRYPGMESYRPPSVQGSILSGISPADRDVVAKSVLSSLGDLRAFYARQPQGSTLWFFVPEVSAWTQTLAQEFRARNGGQERFVVPEGTARSYCSLYRNDSRYHVMPRESLAKEQSFAVIYPPSGDTQKGAVMAGRFLVDRPDWQETDYLSFTTRLLPTQDGLPEADALVWGYLSRANLKARVRFKDWTLSSWANIYFSFYRDASWNGTFSRDAGRGEESFYLDGFPDGSSPYTVRDTAGRDRGTAQVVANKELVGYELDQNAGASFDTGVWANEINGLRFGVWVKGKYEYFTAYDCSWTKRVGLTDIYACKYKDDQGRYRGSGAIGAWWRYRHVTGTVYPLVPQYEVKGYSVYVSLKGWQETWRYASDNDRPVEPFGYVTAEGKRYRIPGLEGYLQPTGKDLEVAEGDPYVSYITRSISPQGNPLAGTGREEAKVWFKPLRDWCAERGL
ncbi:hypothetical protein [Thermus scotoductus]|uniref:Uncharacterized protein n=1 Tax=Thermus scotoductus TaxID=37636 RepID=A0A430RZQ4_THESC|nr:hypothetical protein [Thermus scotoductus]RTH26679.1 hypothetical protein CSW40_04400 [Thermus scotoductus]RTI38663.1 hypothetical protein CSW18_07885 [Thermus scotoductus]